MKLKATKKEIRRGYHRILSIGYCEAQYLLKGASPFAYSTRIEGWACDYYDIDGWCISTGYAPLESKNMKHDYALIREYEDKARDAGREGAGALIRELLEKLTL